MKQIKNKTYKLSCDLFQLDYKEDNVIFYAPRLLYSFVANPDLQNLLAEVVTNKVNSFNVKQAEILDLLENKGIFNQNKEKTIEYPVSKEFKPLSLTLFPTNRCNLRCIYCYASAGELKPLKIKWTYAKTAIDFVIKNVLEAGLSTFHLGFHGGGEPLFEWNLVKKIIEYAKVESVEKGLKVTVSAATNGVLSLKQLEYIVLNFDSLSISFDGNIYSQNYHRPLASGKDSFKRVNRTIKYLDERGFHYGIRSTISAGTLTQMEEIIRFIIDKYKCKRIQLEPISNTGRCLSKTDLSIDLHQFADKFALCGEIAKKYGIQLTYSGCKIGNLNNVFCGISNNSFAITPDGYLATCFEVTSKDDPRSEKFFIGRINEKGEIVIDEDKRDYLKTLKVNNIEYCQDCFAKWHCAGDCLARIGHNNYLGARGHDRCRLNRNLIKNDIIALIESDSLNN